MSRMSEHGNEGDQSDTSVDDDVIALQLSGSGSPEAAQRTNSLRVLTSEEEIQASNKVKGHPAVMATA